MYDKKPSLGKRMVGGRGLVLEVYYILERLRFCRCVRQNREWLQPLTFLPFVKKILKQRAVLLLYLQTSIRGIGITSALVYSFYWLAIVTAQEIS